MVHVARVGRLESHDNPRPGVVRIELRRAPERRQGFVAGRPERRDERRFGQPRQCGRQLGEPHAVTQRGAARTRIRAGALYHLGVQRIARGCLAGLDEDPQCVLHCAGALVRRRLGDQRVDRSVEIAPHVVAQDREQVASRVHDIAQDKLRNAGLHAGVERLLGSGRQTIDRPLQMTRNGSLRWRLQCDRRRVAPFLRQRRLKQDDSREANEGEQPRSLDRSRGERPREALHPQGTGDRLASARHPRQPSLPHRPRRAAQAAAPVRRDVCRRSLVCDRVPRASMNEITQRPGRGCLVCTFNPPYETASRHPHTNRSDSRLRSHAHRPVSSSRVRKTQTPA